MNRKFVYMNLKADIKWIQAELMKVKDPELITVFKSLLKYREKKVAEEKTAFDLSFERALLDKQEGRTKPHEEVRKKYEKWL